MSDRKVPYSSNGTTIDYYNADVVSAQDYYPFGMLQPGRSYNAGGYRYGFNGQERSNEIGDNNYTAEYWEYDSRIGRRWNLDPNSTIGISEYSTFSNNPIRFSDPLGDTVINKDVAIAVGKDRSGMDLAGNQIKAGDYSLVPIQKSVDDKTIIGYNAWRNGKNEYLLDAGDIESFTNNSASYARAADVFYANGTPDYNELRYYYGALNGDFKTAWQGLKGMWKSALKDKAYVASLALSFGHLGVSAFSGEANVTLYRGVNESHADYAAQSRGVVKPNGGNATPLEHNTKSTLNSSYTSWTTNPDVAENYALRPRGGGVVLKINVPVSQTTTSPNLKSVLLKGKNVVVSESEVLIKGPVKVNSNNIRPVGN